MIDVIVAGGGPAGLATAIHGTLAGLRVVVVEPRTAPIDKACGEGLMPGGVAALRSMGVRLSGHPLLGIDYVAAGTRARAAFGHSTGLGVRRTDLHAALAARTAELGIPVVSGKVEHPRQDADGVEAAGLRARWLVAADGLHSPLRSQLRLGLPGRAPARYGQRRHYHLTPWSDHVEVHWSEAGEAYVTPVGDDLVGVAILSQRRGGFDEHLACFPDLRARLDGPTATPVRGAGPLRQRVRRRVAGRVLLVGDAAGYTDAITGEGLCLAAVTAQALVRCLAADRPQDYERAWSRLTRRHRLLAGALLVAARRQRTARLIVPTAARLPALFTRIVRAIAT
ncbi:NAD(P)/FAD-dependent oxidoreductase [Sinosporangium siamense]|uniref:Oxidoreductase n=1 Tax=Sinosporangium siamense TaxID=1367973 RepID=A0A919RPK1_9ACTN|nr:NAD(P)/FAD-dependent oxidoreductase [Sinosporangium siamense]GII96927.1 oxidoreductase [Sinosporangium siamense]